MNIHLEAKSTSKIRPDCVVCQLTVMASTDQCKNGYTIWLCQCGCENEILLNTRYLQREAVTDCGCTTKDQFPAENFTRQHFGRLVCVELTAERGKNSGTAWKLPV